MRKDLLTNLEKEYIIKEYSFGKKITQLIKETKRSKSTINKVINNSNLVKRTRHFEKRKHFFNFGFFKNIDTEAKAYFLGLMFADGTISRNQNYATISLQEEDIDILLKFKDNINFTGDLSYIEREKPRKNMYRLNLGSNEFVKHIEDKGCVYNKSKLLEFPSRNIIPDKLMNHFIRGYLDGDGCIAKYKNNLIVTFVSTKLFIEGLKEYFKSIGFNFGSISQRNNSKGTYCLYFGGNNSAKKILEYIYKDSTIFLLRKKKKYDIINII